LWRGGRPVFVERLEAGGRLGHSALGLAGFPVSSLFLALGREGSEGDARALGEALRALRPLCRDEPRPGLPRLRGVSLRGGLLSVRSLGREAWEAKAFLFSAWEIVRPLLCGLPASPLRGWGA
jgi:hypothetical protein